METNPDFKQLLDNLTTALLLVDKQLRLIHTNTACEALLQISLNHTQGENISSFFYETGQALEKVNSALNDNTPYTKRKAQWQLQNGNKITVDYTVTPLVDSQQILFEIQPLDRLLQISREEAMIASQETTRNLIRGLAHEVKNPLGGIRGAAQLLDRELEQHQHTDLKEYTDVIIAESDRLRKLVDRMLGPRQPANREAVNIHKIVERVITLVDAEAMGSITLKRNYDPSIPPIMGDAELLIQALLNILRNAKQALEDQPENSQPTIEISTRVQRQFTIGRNHYPLVCCISITDNGPGIPQAIQKDIFYPMVSGRAQGTGLGLAISQQLINQHHGLIECNGEAGNTRFSIYIPLE